MFGMSNEQLLGLLRQVLPILGTLAVSLGIMKPETVGNLTSTILTIAGPLLIVISGIWSLVDKTRTSMIAKVDTIAKQPDSPVQGIIAKATPEGRDLAANLPGSTTVPAGTVQAAEIAKAA